MGSDFLSILEKRLKGVNRTNHRLQPRKRRKRIVRHAISRDLHGGRIERTCRLLNAAVRVWEFKKNRRY